MSFERALNCFKWNNFEAALVEFENYRNSGGIANYYHAMTMLALGDYAKGFAEMCRLRAADVLERYKEKPTWHGEADVPVIIVHEAGYGDGVQFMRYVREVAKIASSVVLDVPEPLRRLAAQLAPLVDGNTDGQVAYWFDLPRLLQQTPSIIPPPPYLKPDPEVVAYWARRVGNGEQRIGIVWDTKLGPEQNHAERRPIPIDQFLKLLPWRGELFSLQPQDRHAAVMRNIRSFEISDLADVAALASLMDVVVCVDTAAAHVVGAIDHPNAYVLLPYAATWRWVGKFWYPRLKHCQQTFPGDWESAFAQILEERGRRDLNP
jgi:hypothetical protein